MAQETLMNVSPADGSARPYPSHAGQWREYHGQTAWLFNPWTGSRRDARDVGSDVFGMAVVDQMPMPMPAIPFRSA